MCGIIGVISERIEENDLLKAIKVLHHRGPDGYGIFLDDSTPVGLAHSRLAVIDLETGDQPLFSEDGEIVLVCNGEIYDFENIRRSLEEKGHRFSTKSDSEVIIYLYLEYGMQFFNHLRGEFAFLLYDKRAKKVFAVRDHFGVKPLFYARTANGFVFSSEVKGIFATKLASPELDVIAIRDMMSFVPVDTVFTGIKAVPPGAYMVVNLDPESNEIHRYWDLDLPKENQQSDEKSLDEYKKELREKFDEAVRLRLRADVPVGVYLSGGVDSAGVAGTVKKFAPNGLKVFCIAFTDDNRFNEAEIAVKMAKQIGADYYEVKADNETLLNNLEAAVWYSELPTANCHGVGKFLLSELARDHVKVVLTGEGCDELFLGYDYFKSKGEQSLSRQVFSRKAEAVRCKGNKQIDEITHAVGFVPQQEMVRLFSKRLQRRLYNLFHARNREKLTGTHPIDRLKTRIHRPQTNGREPVKQRQYFSIKGIMAPYILSILGDRAEMAHSIEGRPPLLDHKLFELARDIPVKYKIHNNVEKFIFREIVKDRITEEIYHRKKWPYSAPLIAVQKGQSPAMDRLINNYLSKKAIRKAGVFRYRAIIRLKALRRLAFFGESIRRRVDSLLLYIISIQILHKQFIQDYEKHFD